jgi:hypothetical protein
VADFFDEMVTAAVDAYKAPRLHVNDTTIDRRIDMEAALKAALGTVEESTLYRTVWSIIEEFIVEAKPIDLNEPEGMARMQVVCSLLTVAINPDVHTLDLEAE